MTATTKSEYKQAVLQASRENGISYTLFRTAIGKQLGLNSTDFEGLDLIFYRGVSSPSELSQYTGLSSGSTTAMIDRLERSGLIQRAHNPADGRGVLITITEEARCRVGPFFTSARVAQNDLLAEYSAAELKLLADYFQKSAAMFEAERQHMFATD